MTKKSIITQAEFKRFANLAASEGVTVEIERDGTIIRIMPFQPNKIVKEKESRKEKAERALAEWQEGQKDKSTRA